MKLSDKARQSLDKVVEKFQQGDLSQITKILAIELPQDAPARKWTLSNRVMAYAQTGAADNRGYRQWQEAGRQVKKGCHAGFILFPRIAKKEKDDGKEEKVCIGFGTIAVFSYDDTDGDEIEQYQPKQLPPLMDVAGRLGVDVDYMPLVGVLGYCVVDNSKIRLASHDEHVFFHELAHAAHNTFERGQGRQDEHREAVADLSACILMELYGLRDDTGNTWEYISYYSKDPLRAIMKALSDVEKILEVIFNNEAIEL